MRDQSGNILFYILIAVALLAALSYAVSHTSRGGGDQVSRERAGISASEIVEYANIIGNAVMQIRLRGVGATQISFENEEIDGYENPNCTEDHCKVFAIDGGGVSYLIPKDEWLDKEYSSEPRFGELYFNGSSMALDKGSESKDDLIMFIPYVKKSVCKAINDNLSIYLESDDVPSESSGPFESVAKFTGDYDDAPDYYVAGDSTTGQSELFSPYGAGCTKSSDGDDYHFFKVLLAR